MGFGTNWSIKKAKEPNTQLVHMPPASTHFPQNWGNLHKLNFDFFLLLQQVHIYSAAWAVPTGAICKA